MYSSAEREQNRQRQESKKENKIECTQQYVCLLFYAIVFVQVVAYVFIAPQLELSGA